jgi:hypothetical protein
MICDLFIDHRYLEPPSVEFWKCRHLDGLPTYIFPRYVIVWHHMTHSMLRGIHATTYIAILALNASLCGAMIEICKKSLAGNPVHLYIF